MVSKAELDRHSTLTRTLLVVSGLVLLGLIATARFLEPDSQGYGTHTQLGLGPCIIREVWGVKCPACGMTTAWSYLTRGAFSNALSSNVGGTLLGLSCLVWIPYLLAAGILARWPWDAEPYVVRLPLFLALVAIIIEWLARITG